MDIDGRFIYKFTFDDYEKDLCFFFELFENLET